MTSPPTEPGTAPPADAGTTPPADAGTVRPTDAGMPPAADAEAVPPADAATASPVDSGAASSAAGAGRAVTLLRADAATAGTPPRTDGAAPAEVLISAGVPAPAEVPVPAGVTVTNREAPASTTGFAGVYDLAAEVEQAVRDGAHGVVVVQAAGALAETAWALDLLLAGDAPLVVTAPGDDLADAMTVAAAGPPGIGCVLVANGEIHAARHVGPGGCGFTSADAGPLGRVTGGTVRLHWRPVCRFTVLGSFGGRPSRIGLYTAALGDDGELLRAMAERCDGLIVTATGRGGLAEPVLAALAGPAERIPVVLAAPATGDGFSSTALAPDKARVLMRLLLDAGRDRRSVLTAFAALDGTDDAEL